MYVVSGDNDTVSGTVIVVSGVSAVHRISPRVFKSVTLNRASVLRRRHATAIERAGSTASSGGETTWTESRPASGTTARSAVVTTGSTDARRASRQGMTVRISAAAAAPAKASPDRRGRCALGAE